MQLRQAAKAPRAEHALTIEATSRELGVLDTVKPGNDPNLRAKGLRNEVVALLLDLIHEAPEVRVRKGIPAVVGHLREDPRRRRCGLADLPALVGRFKPGCDDPTGPRVLLR